MQESEATYPTLAELRNRGEHWNSFVTFPGFDRLYMRRGPGIVMRASAPEPRAVRAAVKIADAHATVPGAGAFSRLLDEVARAWPGEFLIIENVAEARFASWLRRRGFENVLGVLLHGANLVRVLPPAPT